MHGPLLVAERRSVPRHSAKELAVVAMVDGSVMRRCAIQDISDRGARLGFGAPGSLPLRFELLLPTGLHMKVTLIWQRDLVAGVSFERALNTLERLAVWNWLRSRQAKEVGEDEVRDEAREGRLY